MSPQWRKVILACSLDGDEMRVTRQPSEPMRADLLALFDRAELKKYMTDEELPAAPAQVPESAPIAHKEVP